MLGTEIVEYFADQAHAFVLPNAWSHKAIKLFVGRIDHHAGRVEQRDFVLRLDLSHLVHELLAVDDLDALSLQCKQAPVIR